METTVKQAAQRGLSRTTVGIIFVVVGVAFQWWERDPSWPVIVGLIVMGGSDVVVAIAQARGVLGLGAASIPRQKTETSHEQHG